MPLSAEVRWFWPALPGTDLIDWFHQSDLWDQPPGGGIRKMHHYLRDASQSDLGIKTRGDSTVEVKGLVIPDWHTLDVSPFRGPVELWHKWHSEALTLTPHPTVAVQKQRWLRLFTVEQAALREIALDEHESPYEAMPSAGCTVELTQLWVDGHAAGWTLGLEAFGDRHVLAAHLNAVAAYLGTRCPPRWPEATRNHYPGWLKQQVEP